ncbi:hypothetical protein Tco_0390026 [Tanacetum coccineum]
MAREAEVKRVVNTGPKFNSVRPNINTGRTNISSGNTHLKNMVELGYFDIGMLGDLMTGTSQNSRVIAYHEEKDDEVELNVVPSAVKILDRIIDEYTDIFTILKKEGDLDRTFKKR